MDPFHDEEASIPAVKSLRSKFEQLGTPAANVASTKSNAAINGRSNTILAAPQRYRAPKGRSLSMPGGEAAAQLSQASQALTKGGDGELAGHGLDIENGHAGENEGGECPIQPQTPSTLAGTGLSRHLNGNTANAGFTASELRSSKSLPSSELRRPPPPAPTGIKRPPPPPPAQNSSTQRSLTPAPLRSQSPSSLPSTLSSSPSRAAGLAARTYLHSPGVSPSGSPHLRPVPLAPSTPSSTVSNTSREGSPRPSSRSDTDEHGDALPSVSSLRNRYDDTAAKMNTKRTVASISYPTNDIPPKPTIPPRPSRNSDAPTLSPALLSTSPDEVPSPPSFSITPPRLTMSSPFSDEETVDQLNLTAPLVPLPARKPPPPKPQTGGTSPNSIRSFGSHSNSSQVSVDTVGTSSSVASGIQRPPPPPPPRSRPKASSVPVDAPSTPSSSKSLSSPPPLPSRKNNTIPTSDYESSTLTAALQPPTPSTATLPPPPPRSSRVFPASPLPNAKQDLAPSQSSMTERKSLGSVKLPPPPMRTIAPGDKLPPARRPGGGPGDSSDDESAEEAAGGEDSKVSGGDSIPDSSRSSRRPPIAAPFRDRQFEVPKIPIHAYGGYYVVAGPFVAVGHNYTIKIYHLSLFDSPMHVVDTKDLGKITCMELKCTGDTGLGEARLVWVGTKEGHVFEVDLVTGAICSTKQVTNLHPLTHVLRHGRAMVTLDEGGKALIFTEGGRGVSLSGTQPRVVRVTEKQDFVRMLGGKLWTAARTDSHNGVGAVSSRLPIIRVYDLFSPGSAGKSIVPTEHVGAVTSAAIIPSHPGKVYVGHEEGYVSIWAVEGTEDGYPKCLEVVKVSTSDVMCVEGVNDRLWTGSRNGMISAYDVSAKPWLVTNSWSAHPGLPVLKLSVDVFGIDEGRLSVVSIGRDEVMRFWDGLLGMDWIENELQKREDSYSKFRNVTALFMSWNCDAARPDSLTNDAANVNLFSDVLNSVDEPPDIIVFGFQEVIDLESRKMAAKNVLLGGAAKKKHHDEGVTGLACSGNGLSEKVTGAYRRWYDRLVKEVRIAMPQIPYTVVHTENLIGLFTCVFVKTAERSSLRDVAVTSVKRGMGGRYGNKGAIVARLMLGDSSICMVNCHLAAGQNAVRRRNADFAAILEEKSVFPPTEHPIAYGGGGDGTMILDHEIVFVNGDMNYRIDHRREAIISSIRAGEYTHILAHDQLLREIKYNRGCRFRAFSEGLITFAPTYKYDPRSNEYDTSEKRRLPAWCDRVLWRTRDPSRVQQLHYRRYEANVSDHRPISAAFQITVKTIEHDVRTQVLIHVQSLWEEEQAQMLAQAQLAYCQENSI